MTKNVATQSLSLKYRCLYFLPLSTYLDILVMFLHIQVSETENLRKNLEVERMIIEGCDILLDVNQVFIRQGRHLPHYKNKLSLVPMVNRTKKSLQIRKGLTKIFLS